MQISGSFNANQHAPKQLGGIHPVGKFPATISNTAIVPTKDNDGGMFVVDFTTPAGVAIMRYNLWNNSPKAVEIAHGQLSALCHVTGVFQLAWESEGAALRGAQCMIEVVLDDVNKPDGYTKILRVFDTKGNEPGKAPAQPQTTGQQWGGAQQQPAAQGQLPQSWGQQTQPQQPQAPQQAPQGWQQGPNINSAQVGTGQAQSPPWAQK